MSFVPPQDFVIKIGLRQRRKYPVEVLDSPSGQSRSAVFVAVPWSESELNQILSELRQLSTNAALLSEFGDQLFRTVFQADVKARYDESLGRVGEQGTLRLHLRIEAPELAVLPWELLYDRERKKYLALSDVEIIRYLSVPQPIRPLQVNLPFRVLVAIANPKDRPFLIDEEREKNVIMSALDPLHRQGMVQIEFLPHTSRDTLREKVRDNFHVLHFIGHGKFEHESGYLLLEDAEENSDPCDGALLSVFLERTSLRLVVLNSCEGARGSAEHVDERTFAGFAGVAQSLVDSGLPAVVAMQFKIVEESSQLFAKTFYEELANFRDIDQCVANARKALLGRWKRGYADWATPVLFLRAKGCAIFTRPELKPSDRILTETKGSEFSIRHPLIGEVTISVISDRVSPLKFEMTSSKLIITALKSEKGTEADDD